MTSPAAISLAFALLGVLSLVAITVRRVDGGARRDKAWRQRVKGTICPGRKP